MLYSASGGGLMNMNARTAEFVTAGTPVLIWMNAQLYYLWDNFRILFFGEGLPTFLDYQFVLEDLHGSNSAPLDPSVQGGYTRMYQEYSTANRWIPYTNIVFLSNTLGVRPSFSTGVVTPNSGLVSVQTAGAGVPSSTVVTDFYPLVQGNDMAGLRGDLVYTANIYRLLDILSSTTTSVDFTILIRDNVGNEFPFHIQPRSTAQIKLLFVKKSLYKNYTHS
jgi:hypothetical protein